MNYSDIFTVHKLNGVTFNNILKKIQLPEDKTSPLYKKYIVPYTIPWVQLSYMVYGDIKYYWLLQLANDEKKLNPFYAEIASEIDIIKPEYLSIVIDAVKNSHETA